MRILHPTRIEPVAYCSYLSYGIQFHPLWVGGKGIKACFWLPLSVYMTLIVTVQLQLFATRCQRKQLYFFPTTLDHAVLSFPPPAPGDAVAVTHCILILVVFYLKLIFKLCFLKVCIILKCISFNLIDTRYFFQFN